MILLLLKAVTKSAQSSPHLKRVGGRCEPMMSAFCCSFRAEEKKVDIP